jgi:signal transduction histidine kinase
MYWWITSFTGDANTTLERRQILSYCLFMAICNFLNAIINVVVWRDTPIAVFFITLIFTPVYLFFYLALRKTKQHRRYYFALIVINYCSITMQWLAYGGISVPFMITFLGIFACFVSAIRDIAPRLFVFNLVYIVILAYIEAHYPLLNYTNLPAAVLLFQSYLLFVFSIIGFFIMFYVIEYCYEEERAKSKASNEQMETMIQIQSQMISIISHDVSTPLSSIEMMIDMITKGMIPPATLVQFAQKLKTNVSQSREVLASLLGWTQSRIQGVTAQTTKLKMTVSVLDIITDIEKEWHTKAQQKNINFKITTDINTTTLLAVSKVLIHTTLRNLFTNALKFTPEQGSIWLIITENPTSVFLEVEDTGMGMSATQQQALFSTRVDAQKGTQGQRGSGIGLWLVNDMLKEEGASITVQSTLGQGSIFTIEIPKSQP